MHKPTKECCCVCGRELNGSGVYQWNLSHVCRDCNDALQAPEDLRPREQSWNAVLLAGCIALFWVLVASLSTR